MDICRNTGLTGEADIYYNMNKSDVIKMSDNCRGRLKSAYDRMGIHHEKKRRVRRSDAAAGMNAKGKKIWQR